MRRRGSLLIFLLVVSLWHIAAAQTAPGTAAPHSADTSAIQSTPVSMPDSLPPIVSPLTPALYDPRANMAWVDSRSISWTTPDASGRKRAKEGARRITEGFYMDKTEVTNEQYAQFLCASDSNTTFYDPRMDIVALPHFQFRAKAGREKFPVAWVDWTSAYAFAKWAKKSLPTEDEWIIAALAGRDLRSDTVQYVWADSTQCTHLNLSGFPGRAAVASYPQGATSTGIHDLAGNVAEWTLTEEPAPITTGKPQPWVVVKGGSFLDTPESMTIFSRGLRDRSERLSSVGFRCILREQPAH